MVTPPKHRYWVVKIWPDGFRQVEAIETKERSARWHANRVCRQAPDGSRTYIEMRDRRSELMKMELVTQASKSSLGVA